MMRSAPSRFRVESSWPSRPTAGVRRIRPATTTLREESAWGTYDEAFRASVTDQATFWLDAARGIDWSVPPTQAIDATNPPFYRWFPDGELSVASVLKSGLPNDYESEKRFCAELAELVNMVREQFGAVAALASPKDDPLFDLADRKMRR